MITTTVTATDCRIRLGCRVKPMAEQLYPTAVRRVVTGCGEQS